MIATQSRCLGHRGVIGFLAMRPSGSRVHLDSVDCAKQIEPILAARDCHQITGLDPGLFERVRKHLVVAAGAAGAAGCLHDDDRPLTLTFFC